MVGGVNLRFSVKGLPGRSIRCRLLNYSLGWLDRLTCGITKQRINAISPYNPLHAPSDLSSVTRTDLLVVA